jgi:hypothetical protein
MRRKPPLHVRLPRRSARCFGAIEICDAADSQIRLKQGVHSNRGKRGRKSRSKKKEKNLKKRLATAVAIGLDRALQGQMGLSSVQKKLKKKLVRL